MDIDLLKTFITVTKLKNISRAGEEIFLTQPAVSKQIKSLEQLYGVKLFERINKKLLLTEEGSHLLDYAYRIINLYDESLGAVSKEDGHVRGTLKIVSNLTIGVYVLPKLIKPFYHLYPDLKIEMFLDSSENIINAVKHVKVNFGFIGKRPKESLIVLHPLFQDKMKIVVGPGILTNKKVASWKELESLPFLQRERGSDIRTTYEQFLEKKHIKLIPKMELNNTEAIKAFLQADMGFTILPLCTIEHELRQGLLRVVTIPHFDIIQEYYICHYKDKMFSKPEKLLFEYIFNAFKSKNPFSPVKPIAY